MKFTSLLIKNKNTFTILILIFITFTGLTDHYWLTLQQNQLLLAVLIGVSSRSLLKEGSKVEWLHMASGLDIFTDGGSRGNPGKAACAFIVFEKGKEIDSGSKYLNIQTNNFAEYSGIVLALNWIISSPLVASNYSLITFSSDSELVVKQLNGLYKIKNPAIKKFVLEIKNLILKNNLNVVFINVPRVENSRADELVNAELDKQIRWYFGDKNSRLDTPFTIKCFCGETYDNMNPSRKVTVGLYSDANILAINILKSFISKNIFVNVVTKKNKEWSKFDYNIYCGGFNNNKNVYEDLSKFLLSVNVYKIKTLIFLPVDVYNKDIISKLNVNENTAVIFVGDLLGPHINLTNKNVVSETLREIVQKRQMSVGIGDTFYPISVSDLIKKIDKWLFSFGPYGKTILVLGNEISSDNFWKENQKLVGPIKLDYDPKSIPRKIPKDIETEILNSDLQQSLIETYKWLQGEQKSRVKHPIVIKPKIKKIKVVFPKWFKLFVYLIFASFVFPLIMILINLAISFVGYRQFINKNDSGAINSFLVAKSFSVISETESEVLSYVPVLGLYFRELNCVSSFIKFTDQSIVDAIPVIKNGVDIFNGALGSDIYNPEVNSTKLYAGLSLLVKDVVSVKTLIEKSSEKGILIAKEILSRVNFEDLLNTVKQGGVIAKELPNILGTKGTKTYLVLFQNNMEIRPTGGFIGSYGLLTFDSGRLSDLTISDIYSADGQLNGHVEPPLPIKKYLGEANWWFRDSNWDPDFPTSAKRAEWFLDKETGRGVDGVIAIDLSPIKEMLKLTGPIYLADFDLDISSDNLYERTQSEVQNNFFAGSRKKANFLTALCRNLITDLTKLNSNQKILTLKLFYQMLNERHIQVFLHNGEVQKAVANVSWDGAVGKFNCGNMCYSDLLGIVEANVGVNKANFFVTRSINLETNVSSHQIQRKLVLNIKNGANPVLGPSGTYKTYIRILVPSDSDVISVTKTQGQDAQSISPDITDSKNGKEVGVYVEILGGQNQNLIFSWKSKTLSPPISEYELRIRKQAGIDAMPVEIRINGASLTTGTNYLYNANLTRDLLWTNKF